MTSAHLVLHERLIGDLQLSIDPVRHGYLLCVALPVLFTTCSSESFFD